MSYEQRSSLAENYYLQELLLLGASISLPRASDDEASNLDLVRKGMNMTLVRLPTTHGVIKDDFLLTPATFKALGCTGIPHSKEQLWHFPELD